MGDNCDEINRKFVPCICTSLIFPEIISTLNTFRLGLSFCFAAIGKDFIRRYGSGVPLPCWLMLGKWPNPSKEDSLKCRRLK